MSAEDLVGGSRERGAGRRRDGTRKEAILLLGF